MEIYSSVPSKDIDPEYVDRQKILDFLKGQAGVYIKARDIAKNTGFPTRGTQVEVRKCITQLIEIDLQPVVSNGLGFMYALNSHQVRFYAKQLTERLLGLQRRISKVQEIARRMDEKI